MPILLRLQLILFLFIPIQQANINQVNIGDVRCSRQFGELFTGGPDLRFVAFLPGDAEKAYTTADQVFNGKSVTPMYLSRRAVKKHYWRSCNLTFISNWRPEYITTHWGIYEDDSHNFMCNSTITFNTSGTYKPIPGVESTYGYKIEIKDVGKDYIGEVTWDRETYLALNNFVPSNYYNGLPPYQVLLDETTGKNYRIYTIGAVDFTLPNYQANVQP
jgi:hypothetical protein